MRHLLKTHARAPVNFIKTTVQMHQCITQEQQIRVEVTRRTIAEHWTGGGRGKDTRMIFGVMEERNKGRKGNYIHVGTKLSPCPWAEIL